MSSVYVVGTFDTKGDELQYVAALIAAEGVPVTTVDVGTHGPGERSEHGEPRDRSEHSEQAGDVGVPAATVAAHHPDGPAAVFTGDRGSAVAAMAVALEHFARARAGDIAAIIGLGGSGGTALITPAMRALPIGLPKVMVSTVASGDVAPYVGPSDIAMLYSVTDVAGLNRISRLVLGNAAHAVSGMAAHPVPPAPETRPALGLTMFGVTTPCVTRVSELLGADYDCLVFHATGTGGQSMEKLVDDGLIGGVLDISTTEVCDLLMGGVMSAGEGRLDAIARTRVPYVGSCGALDMVNFGARATVPERYRDRNLYPHNPQVTLMRTTPGENAEIGAFIAGKLNACDGPVRFLIPEGGVSMIDAPGQPFHDPEADRVLFGTLEREIRPTRDRQLIRLPQHINDPEFASALALAFREIS